MDAEDQVTLHDVFEMFRDLSEYCEGPGFDGLIEFMRVKYANVSDIGDLNPEAIRNNLHIMTHMLQGTITFPFPFQVE